MVGLGALSLNDYVPMSERKMYHLLILVRIRTCSVSHGPEASIIGATRLAGVWMSERTTASCSRSNSCRGRP